MITIFLLNQLFCVYSDMVIIPKVVVDIESIEEGKALLAGATQLFFVQNVSSFSIQSTDPDYPYTIRFTPHQLQCQLGHEGLIACVEAMLAPDQMYVHRNASVVKTYIADEPVTSPDGQYYIYRDYYNDLTGRSGLGVSLFETGETQRLTYAYRYGWNASFLGWAHDSSGAYVLYRPKSALGDLTRSQYPIRKYLVPGAEPRGLPTVISPAPTPHWLPMPEITPPASVEEGTEPIQPIAMAQETSYDGWVIDDVVIEETSPPILTLWIENFPNMNTLQGDTVTNNSDSKVDDWEIELPSTNGPTLHWDIQHSQECWGFGGWSPNGQLFTLKPTGQQSISAEVISPYYLTCFNQFGHTTVQVTPDPGYLVVVSDFRANNQAPLFMAVQKEPITLQWGASYSGGATCQASGAWSGTKSASGSQQIWGLTVGKHRFTLSCPQETRSVLVVVNE